MNGSSGAAVTRVGLIAVLMLGLAGVAPGVASSSDSRARNGLIAYSQETDRCGDDECESYVWTVRPDGRERRRLPCSTAEARRLGCADVLPVFSPAGRTLATATDGVADYTEDLVPKDILAVRDLDGKVRRRIPETGTAITALAWSGDAAQLAFAAFRGIYIVGRDGTGQERFAKVRGGDLAWSRQGRLAWTSELGSLVSVTNEARTQVRRLPVGGSSLAWSPDGSRLAYYASDGEVMKVIRVGKGRRTGRPRTVTRRCTGAVGIAVDTDIAWSPDGRQLLCTTFDGDLISVSIRNGQTRVIVRNSRRLAITSFDWQRAPRGR